MLSLSRQQQHVSMAGRQWLHTRASVRLIDQRLASEDPVFLVRRRVYELTALHRTSPSGCPSEHLSAQSDSLRLILLRDDFNMTHAAYQLATSAHAANDSYAGPRAHPSWSPYDNNGGTCVAVAGDDYCIVAASTRMSTGFSILTRDSSMVLKLSDKVVLVSPGFQADARTLHKVIQQRWIQYQFAHRRPMSVGAMAQLLGNTLYYKRFFPYYTFNLCAGLDEEGKGAVYSYDAIGSHERSGYSVQGSGKDLIQPVLDNQLKAASPLVLPPQNWMSSLPLDMAVDLVKDAFVSAGERDIYTGDAVEIYIMTKEGTKKEVMPLKKD